MNPKAFQVTESTGNRSLLLHSIECSIRERKRALRVFLWQDGPLWIACSLPYLVFAYYLFS